MTQKTAWFMLHRIRLAMQTETFEIDGRGGQVDETFIGGKARNMHAAKRRERIKGRGVVEDRRNGTSNVTERTATAQSEREWWPAGRESIYGRISQSIGTRSDHLHRRTPLLR